jgi:hypothetical protein
MGATRASLIQGPVKAVRDTAVFFTQDSPVVSLRPETSPLVLASHGEIDKRLLHYVVETSLRPDGRLSAALIALFWNNFANLAPGASLFGDADVPLALHASDGALHTFKASAVTRIPDMILGVDQTAIGQATLTGVIGTGLDADDADSLYTVAAGSTFVDATMANGGGFKRQQYFAAWGAVTGFTAFEAEERWTVSFNLRLQPRVIQGVLRDIRFLGVEVMARCVPVGPTSANILAALELQGSSDALPGRSSYDNAAALTITGADGTTTFTIPKASIQGAGFRFGGDVLRQGEVGFYACRNFTTGAQQALYTVAIA